jgi:hypothetical protein
MDRAPATWATGVSLALINVGLAALIVNAVGAASFAPVWLGIALVAGGVAAAVGAVVLWRQYLAEARDR